MSRPRVVEFLNPGASWGILPRVRWKWLAFAGLVANLALGPVASAQDVQAAAAAFGRGQQAQLRGDYARAAEMFELADRAAPSPEALRSAIRNHVQAGHAARAATLSTHALERYPDDEATRTLAEQTLAETTETLARLTVRCDPACALTVDGRAVGLEAREETTIFVDPGERAVQATWSDLEPARGTVTAVAGESARLALEGRAAEPEPEPVEVAAVEVDPPADPEPAPPAAPPGGGGITPVVFFVGAGLTALGAGLSVWSGLETLSARDAYVESPTRAGYENGVGLETRTNVLLFSTLGLAAVTAVLAIFTDWDDDSADVSLTVSPHGAFASFSMELDR